MPCYHLDLPGGGHAIVRGNLGPRCAHCARVGEFLCDFPTGRGKTCSRPMCDRHRAKAGQGVDYCSTHMQQFLAAGGKVSDEPSEQAVLF